MQTSQNARIGIIGGSGLGNALLAGGAASSSVVQEVATPFGKPSAPIMLAEWESGAEKVPIAFLARHGVGHTIPPSAIPVRANIWALKAVGCRWIIASGAVGSLREEMAPRQLALVNQFIDKTYRRVGTFFDELGGGAVHVELAEPVCPRLYAILRDVSRGMNLGQGKVHARGTYVCMEGPAFSTRAESLMHQHWGGDLIGMTSMPEAKLAREAEMSYALVALITDYDCWRPHPGAGQSKQALLAEIIGNMQAATDNALALVRAAVPEVWARRNEEFPAHRALELAIWTDKSLIPAATKKRLELLWSKYV
ncbi:MAG TPA: MTAP family purine nucleoside phosphorylase [Bryobacteraceae bacterium]